MSKFVSYVFILKTRISLLCNDWHREQFKFLFKTKIFPTSSLLADYVFVLCLCTKCGVSGHVIPENKEGLYNRTDCLHYYASWLWNVTVFSSLILVDWFVLGYIWLMGEMSVKARHICIYIAWFSSQNVACSSAFLFVPWSSSPFFCHLHC